jgi:hypothetical protein
MKDPVRVEIEVVEEIKVKGNEMGMAALVRVNYPVVEQNEQLPYRLEMISQEAGLEFMKKFFCLGIEKADLELCLSIRAVKDGEGIIRIGKRPSYTFRTIFGTVIVPRIRIKYKGSGKSETPSARMWKAKRQVMLSKGLKNAVCNTVVKESYASTLSQIERQTGERGIVSKSSIGNILRQEGERLAKAQAEQADKVFEADDGAKVLLGRAAQHLAAQYFEQVYLNRTDLEYMYMTEAEVEQLFYEIEWDPYEELVKKKAREYQEEIDQQEKVPTQTKEHLEQVRPEVADLAGSVGVGSAEGETIPSSDDLMGEESTTNSSLVSAPLSEAAELGEQIIAQVDEVVVRKQPGSKRDKIVHYNGVIKTAERSYYCSGTPSAQLIYQMGSI